MPALRGQRRSDDRARQLGGGQKSWASPPIKLAAHLALLRPEGQRLFQDSLQTAWEDGARLNAEDYGRWTTSAYKIGNDSRTAIAYSQPLILPDGTIYGVVGVELLTSCLQTKLPLQ